jgi:tetratricopeptide (TPR) repeat protein
MPQRPGLNVTQAIEDALALQRQGRLRDAEKIYNRILKLVPDHFDSLNLLGGVKLAGGQAGEAYRLIRAALEVNPGWPDAWINLGHALHALKRDAEALDSFDKALSLKPDDVDARMNRGHALLSLGRGPEAVACFEEVLSRHPRHTAARLARGSTLSDLGRYEEALADLDAVLSVAAADPLVHYNRGTALLGLARYGDAIAAFDAALAIRPDYPAALSNRGRALQELNRHHDALASFRRAIAVRKDYADAHFHEAMALLTTGDYRAGFEKYEWRWKRSGMPAQRRNLGRPLWLGEYPLGRKTILLHAEQGLGDTIQFARYAALLARSGAQVVLEVQPELKALLSGLESRATVVAQGEPLPPFDVHCPLASLPLAFRSELASVPVEIPYLTVDAGRVAAWEARLAPMSRPRIAVVWAGRATHVNDRNRSVALAALAPLWSVEGAQFLSLQRDLRERDAAVLAGQARLAHLGGELNDFSDTAAVLALADLLISVDTSVVHLAGALGRPVWVLVPFSPDWRWTLDRDRSPWYPDARLFRQPSPGDWSSVIAHVREEVCALVAASRVGGPAG